jgi:uncharacterized protein YceH (UPF0502 family)
MSAEGVSYGVSGPWPVFNRDERRVLGTLIEKSKTSADGYPMSLNALVSGCNQKSNRDPVLELDEDEVQDALNMLKSKALVTKVFSGRTEKWRHLVYEQWHLDSREMAILAELLLRGPQTEGEIRTRASRMVEIPDLESLKGFLKPLLERTLILYLTPEDRRGAVLTHGFHEAGELARLKAHYSSGPASVAPAPVAAAKQDDRIPALEAGLAALREEFTRLREEFTALKRSLGG